jgi:hypothetical protein
MTPEVTKTVLNKIILNVWIENGPINIIIWPRDRASISVQQLRIKLILFHQESRPLQNVDIAPQHRSSKNESIQNIIFIQPGLSLHPFFQVE